ncbi:hypothetical protein DRF69_09720 [Chryseobacterium sp. 5_R23647]|nr:hypothetical protein DRF69_09720 [Chryseobacterium sp. 5_R23647]
MYPNPAQDFIQLEEDTSKDSKIKIYSLDRKLIKTTDIKSGKLKFQHYRQLRILWKFQI